MKNYLLTIIESLLRLKRHIKYSRRFRGLLKSQHIINKPAPGEEDYVAVWKQLYSFVEPYSYRFYRHYCGDNPYIVPEDIGHSFIETMLNPNEYTSQYEDKNNLPLILPKGYVPQTILCRMRGGDILNAEKKIVDIDPSATSKDIYTIIGGDDAIIIKPSVDSNGGDRVMKFVPKDNKYVSANGLTILDGPFLKTFAPDWVMQRVVRQHAQMQLFCSTAVNTIRVNTYRSFVDEQIYIVSAALRVARDGSIVDNGHAGGGLVRVDLMTGELGHEVVKQCGDRMYNFNGVNYSELSFKIPNWDKVKLFCQDVASYNHHCRLIAMDVAIQEDGMPILIEWNVSPYSFSYWIPMLTGSLPFGNKTEEIIQYCKKYSTL